MPWEHPALSPPSSGASSPIYSSRGVQDGDWSSEVELAIEATPADVRSIDRQPEPVMTDASTAKPAQPKKERRRRVQLTGK